MMMMQATKVRIGQYGTKHPHCTSVTRALRACPDVDFVGIFEPDSARRAAIQVRAAARG
jgi:hypothetical protein